MEKLLKYRQINNHNTRNKNRGLSPIDILQKNLRITQNIVMQLPQTIKEIKQIDI